MPKKQKIRKFKKGSSGSAFKKEPTFNVVLTYDVAGAVSAATDSISIVYEGYSGFPQLATFFLYAKRKWIRLRVSYTGWSGVVSFMPVNYLSLMTSTASLYSGAIAEMPGSVRVQSGADNTGKIFKLGFKEEGFSCQELYNSGSPTSTGWLFIYNSSYTTGSYPINMQIETMFSFRGRNPFVLSITPDLTVQKEKFEVLSDKKEESKIEEGKPRILLQKP